MNNPSGFSNYRLLLYYKGDISALVMFAQQANGSVCFPDNLPILSSAMEPEQFTDNKVILHPVTLIQQINQLLQFDNSVLQAEPGFNEQIDTPGGIVTVHLARFMVLDPPHQLLKSRDCRMRTLPELRTRPPAELELLRRAYVQVMEG